MEIIIILFLIAIPVLGYLIYKNIRRDISTSGKIIEFACISIFSLSLALFAFSWSLSSADYYTPIDIVDNGYTPFASKHVLILCVFFSLAIGAIFVLWLKSGKLPPLLWVLALTFLLIGMLISLVVIVQISSNTEDKGSGGLMLPLPLSYIFISGILIFRIITDESQTASTRFYKNKCLNYLNMQMGKARLQPIWVFLLLIPVFILVVAILVLFGQDTQAITKVFTETTTWHFSEKTHPPFLDHRGHYLCTVAACGDPDVVKPLRLGKRHGHEIIVNRQLLIANAFEELLQENMPALHQMIRKIYDQYGYPLSRKITSKTRSNLVYRLMKPLECFFLILLYLCCNRPEAKINKQYSI